MLINYTALQAVGVVLPSIAQEHSKCLHLHCQLWTIRNAKLDIFYSYIWLQHTMHNATVLADLKQLSTISSLSEKVLWLNSILTTIKMNYNSKIKVI